MRPIVAAVLGLTGVLVSACSVDLSKGTSAGVASNQCESDSDCGKGACHSGICVAHEGALSTLLLEILPPPAAVGVGGVRFLQVETDLGHSSDETKINLSRTTDVHGYVRVAQKCARSTVPVKVTLTPREEGYGLSAVSYFAKSVQKEVLSTDPCYGQVKDFPSEAGKVSIQEFVLSVPVATNSPVKCGDGAENKACYDVYVEPQTPASPADGDAGAGPGADDCTFVPQYFPNYAVGVCFAINATPPQSLKVVVPWPPSATGALSLDGWTLDIVHPLSGHVLSNRVVLRSRDDKGAYAPDVLYAPLKAVPGASVAGDASGKELVRLTPPPGVMAPVIEAELSALQATDTTKAVFPEFGPFPAPVPFESWVWGSGEGPAVPGSVELTATKDGDHPALDGVKPGIFASFSVTVQVGPSGKLEATVPPGHYRARAIPEAGLGRSAAESTLDVACDHAPTNAAQCAPADPAHLPLLRAGSVLIVPRAARITGEIVKPTASGSLEQAVVYAQPAAFKARECLPGGDAAACAASPLGVLEQSLGEDAFVPRTVSTPVVGSRFTLDGVDCGSCTAAEEGSLAPPPVGASFDLSVHTLEGSRLPWLLRSGVYVSTSATVSLGLLPLSLPIVHRGVVQIPQTDFEPLPVPSALIKAYVMRDDEGAVIKNPGGLSSCASSLSAARPATRCIRSVLQVAETRAGSDGTFELVIPSELQ